MYNSKYKVKYNSKVAEVRNIDPAVNTDYQKMVGESAFGEPAEQRMGNVHIDDAQKMWDSNKEHWYNGNYPSIDHVPEGMASTPHKGFADRLSQLPAVVSRADVGDTPPERQIFSGIKHYDSGRHFDIHLFYEPDGTDSFRLKASTHIPGNFKTNENGEVDHNSTNLHGQHVFDVASGAWHPKSETHESPNATTSYNPIEVLQSAPEDFADTTGSWTLPTHSEGFCPTCHRFPKLMSKMLDLMRPNKCTVCGEKGRYPKYDWEPGMFPYGRETSAMRQPVSAICGNTKCVNHGNSIAANEAFVDNDYNVLYPGQEGSGERRVYRFSPELHEATTKNLEQLQKGRPDLVKTREEARQLGDLSENEDYKASDRALKALDEKIHLRKVQLNPAHHTIDGLPEGRQNSEFMDEEGNVTAVPFDTVFDNPMIKETYANGNQRGIKRIKLPILSLFCDNKDCIDYGEPIATHVDVEPNKTLPCSHCGRSEKNGVSIARTDGYNRCNPLVYGANNCAPVPEGVDPESYLGFFKPDPQFKFPTVKPDAETGAGIVFQRDASEQNRNSPEGLYPGTQAVLMRNPLAPSNTVGHGVESVKNFFLYGKNRPWAFLGMNGRKVANKTLPSEQENVATLGDEAITPNSYDEIVRPSILGDAEDIDANDFLPGSDLEISTKYPVRPRNKQVATNSEGEVLHPDLTQEEYNEYLGYNPKSVLGAKDFINHFLSRFSDPSYAKKYPLRLKRRGESITKKSAINDDYDVDPSYDPNDLELRQSISMPKIPRTKDVVLEGEGMEAPEKELCPTCNGNSVWNKLNLFRFWDTHCRNCKDDTCGTVMNDQQDHCNKCKQKKKGCKGRRKSQIVFKDKDHVCPTCNNTGEMTVNRKHCSDCENPKCSGVSSADTIHCDGCPEHDLEMNGYPHDDTPGQHARNSIDSNEESLSPETVSLLKERVKNSLIPNPEAEGIDPKDTAALDYARSIAAEDREENLAKGYVKPTPNEQAISDIENVGPVVFLRDRGQNIDQPTMSSLEQDLQSQRQEKPSFMGQNAMFDDPQAIAEQEAMMEQDGLPDIAEPEELPEDAPKIINNVPIPRIEHDMGCPKCNRGIIRPEVVGPEEMARLNGIINEGTAIIKRTVKEPSQQRQQISQLLADTYKCEG